MPKIQHSTKPDIYPFYDVENGMKRGGKKHKHKKSKSRAPSKNSNVNTIKINIGKVYDDMTHKRQFQAPRRPMANPPKALQASQYRVPNSTSYFSMGVAQPTVGRMPVSHVVQEVPNPLTIPTFRAAENPQGISTVSTNAQRAIPSKFGENNGGVFAQSVNALSATSLTPSIPENYQEASVSYFKPTGRGNTPAPLDRQFTLAKPTDFIPLYGMSAPTREEEMARNVIRASVDLSTPNPSRPSSRSRHRSPSVSRDEDFMSPTQLRSAMTGEAISNAKKGPGHAPSRSSLEPVPESSASAAGSKRRGGRVAHCVF